MSWRVEEGQQNAAQTSDTSLKTTLNSANEQSFGHLKLKPNKPTNK